MDNSIVSSMLAPKEPTILESVSQSAIEKQVEVNQQSDAQIDTSNMNYVGDNDNVTQQDTQIEAPQPLYETKLKNIEKFEYEVALVDMPPKKLLDLMQNSPKFSSEFDFENARKEMGDEMTLQLLMRNSDKARERMASYIMRETGDFAKGALKAATNMQILKEDALNVLHITDDKEHNKRVIKLRKFIKDVESTVDNQSLFSTHTLGEIATEIASMPIAVTSRIGIFITSAIAGYASARGEGLDEKQALMAGGASGALGVGASYALPMAGNFIAESAKMVADWLPPVSKRTLRSYYRHQFNLTKEESAEILQDYYKVMEPSGDVIKDEVVALVEYAGRKGADLKRVFAEFDNVDAGLYDKSRVDRLKKVNELASRHSNLDIKEFSKALKDSVDVIQKQYNKFTLDIGSKYSMVRKPMTTLPKEVEEIKTDREALKDLLNSGLVEDYIEAMPHLNNIISKTDGIHKKAWSEIKDLVESNIRDLLDEDDFKLWRKINDDYSTMKTVVESNLGEALLRATSSKGNNITVNKALELLKADQDSGFVTYSMLRDMVGGEQATKFELKAIENVLSKHQDDVNWQTFYNSVKTKGFVTPEAQRLVGLLETLNDTFRTDAVVSRTLHTVGSSQNVNNLATSITGKAMMQLTGELFKVLLKFAPTKSGRAMRMESRLMKLLKNPQKVKEFSDFIRDNASKIEMETIK